ncbi:hypothetical protein [Leeia oryzae]|uniref:hypothetical protein n=1 Tax=Leeia oryzae TaxID=356662 RepID=UPI00037336A9|nr:hypothetical protein [Leeia oryzae]
MQKKKPLLLLVLVFAIFFLAGIISFAYLDAQLTDGCPDVARVFQWADWEKTLYDWLYWPVAVVASLAAALGFARLLIRGIRLRMR